jgi:hypothetical protein
MGGFGQRMLMHECGVHTGSRYPQPRYWVSENATEMNARLYVIGENLTSHHVTQLHNEL